MCKADDELPQAANNRVLTRELFLYASLDKPQGCKAHTPYIAQAYVGYRPIQTTLRSDKFTSLEFGEFGILGKQANANL